MEEFQVSLDWANRTFGSIIVSIVVAVLILVIGRWLAKWIARYTARWLERADVDKTVVNFVKMLVYVILLVSVIIAALNTAGIRTTSFTALLASAALAIGLALQNELSNFAAGVMILLVKPFKVTDFVEAGGANGTVESVTIFNTVMSTPDNIRVIVPNAKITRENIKNFSANDLRRVDLVASIGYDDNIGQARDILMAIMTAHPLVAAEPAPAIDVLQLGDNSVDLAVRPWVKTPDFWRVRSDILEQMKERFEAANINIPFPQHDVYLHQVS
jgi:small conductance mechanosensitive channel